MKTKMGKVLPTPIYTNPFKNFPSIGGSNFQMYTRSKSTQKMTLKVTEHDSKQRKELHSSRIWTIVASVRVSPKIHEWLIRSDRKKLKSSMLVTCELLLSEIPKRGRSKHGQMQKHANEKKRAQMTTKERKRKSARALSFLSLVVLFLPRKTRNLPRIFFPCRTHKTPEKTRENAHFSKEMPFAKNQPRKSLQSRKGRSARGHKRRRLGASRLAN